MQETPAANMYDIIKKKHDTPSPEKRGSRYNRKHIESDGDDEEEEEESDNVEEEEEEECEGDEESQRKRYLLRKKRPVINRYMAPPMKSSRGLYFITLL